MAKPRSINMSIATLTLCFLLVAFASAEHRHRRQLRYGREQLNVSSDFQGIVGGNVQTTPISYFVKFEGSTLCGASLITTDTVLTAAHCVDKGFPTSVRIAPTDLTNGIVVNVTTSSSKIHPSWTGENIHVYSFLSSLELILCRCAD